MQSFFGEFVATPAGLLRVPDDQNGRFDFSGSTDALGGARPVAANTATTSAAMAFATGCVFRLKPVMRFSVISS